MGINYPRLLIVFLLLAIIGNASGAIYVENATVFNFNLNTISGGLNGSMNSVQPRIFTEHIDYVIGQSLTTPSLVLNNSLNTVKPRIFTEHIDYVIGQSLTTPSLVLNNSLNTVKPRIFTEHIDSILGPSLTTPSLELNNYLNTVRPRIFIESTDMLWFTPLINITQDLTPPDGVTDLHETGIGTTWINWTWDNPNNTDFGHAIISINETWKANSSANYFNATGLNLDTTYEIAIKTADIWGNVNESPVHDTAKTLGYVADISPPSSVTDLQNTTYAPNYINWSWINPSDTDFSHVMVFLNGIYQRNVTAPANFYNTTDVNPDTEYIISTHTVDTSGNINSTWMNNTTRTAPSMAGDITPPASIKNPHTSSFGTTWINWTWTNPSDFDFNHTMLYLDGSFVDNFSITYYNVTNLLPSSTHTISTHTVDTSGNINQTWINDTALTAGDLSNGLNINVYKPQNFSVYPVGEILRFDIEVTDSVGNPVDSGTSAYAGLSGPNDASKQIILTKNGTNFTGEYVVQKDDPRGIWTANITAYNTTNSGRVSVKIIIIGAYLIQPTANSRSFVIGETANFTARVVKPENPSQILTDKNLSLNMTVYHFNSSTPILEPVEMLFNDTTGLFYRGVDTGLLGSGLFTIVFDGKDNSGNVENASIMIGVSENFSITIASDRVYYDRGEPVNIYGTVRFDNNSPISNANVNIQLNLQNFKRSYSVITNETGGYNYTFRPFAAEAGNYTLEAAVSNLGLQRIAQSDFTIYGLYLAPRSATMNMVENSTQKINFTLYNLGDTKLTGIKPVIKDLDNSDTVTASINPADIPSELLPYNSTSITVQINAGTPVPDKAVIQVEVTTDQNSNEVSELNVNLFSPTPIVKVYPENIQIGLKRNQTAIKTITIANIGYGLLKNITLKQLNNSWSRITSNTSLGDLKPGENASFDVHINSYNVDLGTYYDTVNITSDNYDDVKVNLTAYVTDLKNGSLLFHVRDALEKELPDANISLINQETYEEFDIITNSSGYALLNNLPIGRYIFEVSSDGTNTLPQTGTVEVEAMETPKLIEISLYMSFIDFDWEVIPTSIEDYYNIILRMRFETDVPIPLLLAFPPNIEYNMAPGEEKTGTFMLYNVGLVSIYNVTISPIKYNGIILDPMITEIGEIKGKSNLQIPYKIKLASNAASCQELSGKINIRGRYLHFINNHEVISYIGTTIPVLVKTPVDETCKININFPNFCFNIDGYKFGNQTENLSVDPSTIWFLTGEWSDFIENNSLLLPDVSMATNNNEIGDIRVTDPIGITFSFGLGDIISLYNPSISLGLDIIGDGLDIPFFNGIWKGDFESNQIPPSQNSTLNLERLTTGVGVTLPELIGGGLVFQFGNTTCLNCIWILPMGGLDVSLPRPGGLPNITIYHPQVRLIEGTVGGGGTFCWNCFPDVFIVPTLPHIGGTTYVPWDLPEWVWNVPTSDPIRPVPKPKVTQTIHEVVELSISQNVTMERDAFWGGLGIRNRMLDKNINNVRVDLQIMGNGGSANDKFFIQAPRLNGINNIDGSGVISSSSLAKAQWLMIPKPGAGGGNPEGTKYNISANISYSVDGVNFEISTQEVEILVKPQPEVVLDYFIPSDVIANKPFKLAVKATNEGYGTARNFSIETAQPVIYYNPSGLLIDFEIIRSQLQGQERSTSLKIDFGNIEPAESKLAWWDMVTSIDGTFTEFNGEYTHTSELGGMETSLIKKINTYIIQKQMGTGEIGYDFLANSKSNENYYMLFNSTNGNSTFVNRANYTVVNMPTQENPVLNVSMEDYTGQWIIVSIEDPYNNLVPIETVIRTSDGTEIPSYNYWMRNGRIMIVDHYEEGFDGKYTVTYQNGYNKPSFKFIQLTDVHIGPNPTCLIAKDKSIVEKYYCYIKTDEISKTSFGDMVENIKNIKPDFVLITGDLVEWDEKGQFNSLKEFLVSLNNANIKVYTVPGNHDRRNLIVAGNDLANYNNLGTDVSEKLFISNGYKFIGLDSGYDIPALELWDNPYGSGLSKCKLLEIGCTDQINFLKDNINDKTIIFMHHPAIDAKTDAEGMQYNWNKQNVIFQNAREFINLMKYKDVKLVLTGHTHANKLYLNTYIDTDLNPFCPDLFCEYYVDVSKYFNLKHPITLDSPLFVQTRTAQGIFENPYPELWGEKKDNNDIIQGYLTVDVLENGDIQLEDEKLLGNKNLPLGIITLHSPADLHIYDEFGRHTGSNVSGAIDNEIPNSYYFEESKVENITLPAFALLYNITMNYTYEIRSNFSKENITSDQSTFNLTIEQKTLNSTTIIEYNNVLINNNSRAWLKANQTDYAMQIDLNNDSIIDTIIMPDSIITDYTPIAIIQSPANGSAWDQGQPITFNGVGLDNEDGTLMELTWISDMDNVIGHGIFTSSNLSAGVHNIFLRVNDTIGQVNSSNITIFVHDRKPPLLIIEYPNENKTFNKPNISVSGLALDDSGILNVTVSGKQAGKESWNTIIGLNEGENRIEVVATDNYGFTTTADRTVYYNSSLASDIQPPAAITNLTNRTGYDKFNGAWINWTWDNPKDQDFSYAIIYLDDIPMGNTSRSYFNLTRLSSDADYNISILTADIVDNINYSEVKDTTRTPLPDTASPQNIKDPSLQAAGTTWLNFTWLNPSDTDFNHTELYLNGTFITSVYSPLNYYNFTGLYPDTLYELGTHTVDTSGNINQTWVNATAKTTFSAGIRGDLNGNGQSADAGDLVLMKRASIGEFIADSSYDLNNNGQFADAGDLVLMKRASIGEINL